MGCGVNLSRRVVAMGGKRGWPYIFLFFFLILSVSLVYKLRFYEMGDVFFFLNRDKQKKAQQEESGAHTSSFLILC